MMSTVAQPDRNSTSSDSTKGSNKRKSFDGENDENVPKPNCVDADDEVAPKKLKYKEAVIGSASKSAIAPNTSHMPLRSNQQGSTRSALPRFNGSRKATTPSYLKKKSDPTKSAERQTPSRSTTPAKSVARNTPAKAVVRQDLSLDIVPARGVSTTTNALLKSLKEHISSGEKIREYFDGNFTTNAEQVSGIVAHARVKNKWDYKEKSKKQDTVIRELRENLLKIISDAKSVRENCLSHDSKTLTLLRDSYDEIEESSRTINNLRAEHSKLHDDVGRLQDDLFRANTAMMRLKTDQSPLRNRAKDSEQRLFDLQSKMVMQDTRCSQLENDLLKCSAELADQKATSDSLLRSQREDFDRRLEQTVQGYREEVAALRSELTRRQSDADRFSGEKADQDKRRAEMHEEVVRVQSQAREAEAAALRAEKEAERLSEELKMLRDQANQKDADLRSTISSLNDIQKQASEEKNSLRAETSALQGRIQRLEEERVSSASELAARREELVAQARDLAQLREAHAVLEAKLAVKEGELQGCKEAAVQLEVERELRARCEIREEAERTERIAASSQLLATQSECANRIREVEEKKNAEAAALQECVTQLNQERNELREQCRLEADKAAGLQTELQHLHNELEHASANHEAIEQLSKATGELEVMRRRNKELAESLEASGTMEARRVAEYEEKILAGEAQRRRLHNLIQELRGNVRVFARVRPFLPNDGVDMTSLPSPSIAVRSDINSLRIARAALGPDGRSEEHSFQFDKVFGPSSSQEAVFQEVAEFVQSALDGYNVCLFSYGQTGSGKTHSMQGSGNGSMRGVIPRAMEQVGQYKRELESKGWSYSMEVSFIEIYNETIRDLLPGAASEDAKYEIKRDAQGNVYVTDVTMVPVDPNDPEQVDAIMEQAARHRSVGQTNMNERSSRSHSIFALHLHAHNAEQGLNLKGTLSLVDLAGSERLDRSGAEGQRKAEAVAINKSLSALTDVFVAIGNKQSHIPFRNSKLTYLLQPALSGDGKTLMMVNLSPTDESYGESLCSLRLAERVNQCELGKPKRQIKDGGTASSGSASAASTPSQQSHKTAFSLSMGSLPIAGATAASRLPSGTPKGSFSASLGSSRKPPSGGASTLGASRKVARK